MRTAFIEEMTLLAKDGPRLVIVSGDVGNRMFNNFAATYPGRFINAGIAEAGMIGVAAGMAMAGLKPVTYAIASFCPGRCLEQIRLDVCQHNLPVIMIGVGAGLSYASLGPTHHALEDIAWLRAIPNMTILCPGDPSEVRAALRAAVRHDGPVYIRLGKKGEPQVHASEPDIRIGKALTVKPGSDAAILAVGTMLPAAIEAAEALVAKGISASVHSFCSVKPMDEELLSDIFSTGGPRLVAVVEEHVAAGGVWSAIAEWLVVRGGGHVPVMRFGVGDHFHHEAGGQGWTRERRGISGTSIAKGICLAFPQCKMQQA